MNMEAHEAGDAVQTTAHLSHISQEPSQGGYADAAYESQHNVLRTATTISCATLLPSDRLHLAAYWLSCLSPSTSLRAETMVRRQCIDFSLHMMLTCENI